jgi:hypothetical protein
MEVYGSVVPEEEEQWPVTDFSCSAPFCGEAIPYAENIFVVTMYTAGMTEAGIQYAPVPADDGDYLYEPCWFCEECWKSVRDELQEYTESMPPIADDYAAFHCNICDSGIRLGELFGVVTGGQLQVSERCPDSVATPKFQPMDDQPTIICIACMNVIERDVAELWGGRITEKNECEEGTFVRCWRHGCPCDGENCSLAHPMEAGL